jgi:hypothetical protein
MPIPLFLVPHHPLLVNKMALEHLFPLMLAAGLGEG